MMSPCNNFVNITLVLMLGIFLTIDSLLNSCLQDTCRDIHVIPLVNELVGPLPLTGDDNIFIIVAMIEVMTVMIINSHSWFVLKHKIYIKHKDSYCIKIYRDMTKHHLGCFVKVCCKRLYKTEYQIKFIGYI